MTTDAYDLGEALDNYERASDFVKKAMAAEALAETVRSYMEDNDPDALSDALSDSPRPRRVHPTPTSSPHAHPPGSYFANGRIAMGNAIQTGLNIWHSRTVSYDGETYPTAFNAFQAQKEAKVDRKNFTTCSWSEAAVMGRNCKIDVTAWDAGREELIANILFEQASQHQDFAKKIIKCGDNIVENSMGDRWWVGTMPRIWKVVRQMVVDKFPTLVDDDEDDEDDEDEAQHDDEKEKAVHHKPKKHLKRLSKPVDDSSKKPKKAARVCKSSGV